MQCKKSKKKWIELEIEFTMWYRLVDFFVSVLCEKKPVERLMLKKRNSGSMTSGEYVISSRANGTKYTTMLLVKCFKKDKNTINYICHKTERLSTTRWQFFAVNSYFPNTCYVFLYWRSRSFFSARLPTFGRYSGLCFVLFVD